jgi:hypothetical protein
MIEVPLTPDEFSARVAQLAEQHAIVLTGTEGRLSKSGVTAGYRYAAGVLQVTILEKPFFVSTEYCEEQLRRFLGV